MRRNSSNTVAATQKIPKNLGSMDGPAFKSAVMNIPPEKRQAIRDMLIMRNEAKLNTLQVDKAKKSDAFYKDARVVSCQSVLVKNGSSLAIGFKNSPPIQEEYSKFGIANLVGGGTIINKEQPTERKRSLAQ
jgi:hypothetical protein